MFRISLLLLGFVSTAILSCAPATSQLSPKRLRVSALEAAREARTMAVSWDERATLEYLEGEGITPEGYILPGTGSWRFIYGAPGRAEELVVTVTPIGLERTTRPERPVPGLAAPGASLPAEWLDSPAALERVRAEGADALLREREVSVSLLLLPTRPAEWTVRIAAGGEVREWRVDAQSGAVRELVK